MLTIESIKSTKKSTKSPKAGVRVTKKVAALAEEKPFLACISVHGGEDLATYRGPVRVSAFGREYTLLKTDSHVCWATQQEEHLEDFCELFNQLVENPGTFHGEVTPIEE